MALRNTDEPVFLQQFEVKGYKNLAHQVTFGPLGRINVIHGENNVGKSNLLEALDLFFKLLGHEKTLPKDSQRIPSGDFQNDVGYSVTDIFNFLEPLPIELMGHFFVSPARLRESGIELSLEAEQVSVGITLKHTRDAVEYRISRFRPTKGGKDWRGLNFANELLKFLARVSMPQTRRVSDRFVLVKLHRRTRLVDTARPTLQVVPQGLREVLFDIRQSKAAAEARRWDLFVQAMSRFAPILGPGQFDTAFDRESGHADLVFDSGDVRVPVDLLGSGVQQIVALLGQLLMTSATLVGIEEPELNLRYTLQKQLLAAFQDIVNSEYGPEQLFLTSHSPAFEAEGHFFAMEMQDGAPALRRVPRARAREYTGTRDEEDLYPQMHARQPEPTCYVSSEGLVRLPDDVRQKLHLEQGGGVSLIPNKQTGRYELWTTDEVEDRLVGAEADDAG
ncbi:MAG: AAA family ATPase [Chloroflexi bacterium]|nr:AAA family ATPase [Chloroflexota bacterium]MBU1747020.1 AAA family ATPase [Chloroflexota bacterium]